MMRKSFAIWGAFFALSATALGASGAHSLKPLLSAEHLESFKTAVQYQFYHAFAILVVAIWLGRVSSGLITAAGYCFIAGIFCFSGSIFLLSTTEVTGLEGIRFLGPITPMGGLMFMAGWVLFIVAALKNKS